MKVKSLSHVQLFVTPWTVVHGILQARILEWVAFPLNPGLPRYRRVLYQLSHWKGPKILEWVDCSFSGGFSTPGNWTRVSCIAGRFFTSWTSGEAPQNVQHSSLLGNWIPVSHVTRGDTHHYTEEWAENLDGYNSWTTFKTQEEPFSSWKKLFPLKGNWSLRVSTTVPV